MYLKNESRETYQWHDEEGQHSDTLVILLQDAEWSSAALGREAVPLTLPLEAAPVAIGQP
ncbi:hypothetical protein N7533_002368 [Penicillium manginii]|jgi:hypothetical protein|uniref:uncharacterized protein n=1 Tax=Penicillium manginii TaxID=203109 RepID=UPI002546EF8C|nr:uncharacterized protein N7533_002368 [Penicillium manginii]KAJ5763687.1 hypothetical protein N7533_002368 [Penicillium manginii]